MNDEVSHPSHYTSGSIECIDAMEAAFGKIAVLDYCVCNVVKYLWRHRQKGRPLTDLSKARWYLDKAIELTCDMNGEGNGQG